MQPVVDAIIPRALPACNGEPGKIKPGMERLTYIGSAAIGAFIAESTAGIGAVLLAGILGGVTWDLLNICSAPQPPDVTLTDVIVADALAFSDPLRSFPAQQTVIQWFTHQMWPLWCDCLDGSHPPPVLSPSPPASDNPGLPPGPDPDICRSGRGYSASSTPGLNQFVTFYPVTGGPPNLPVGATSVRTWGRITKGSGTDSSVQVDLQRSQNGGLMTTYRTLQLGLASTGPSFDWSIPVDPATTATGFVVNPANTQLNLFIETEAAAYCGPANGSVPVEPCCPPDPNLDQRLTQITGMLTAIWNKVSQAPGAVSWKDGTRHTGLANNGYFALDGPAIGIRVEMTTQPTGVLVNPGTPAFYWDAGFITPYAMDTPLRGNRLVFHEQSFQLPAVTDAIGYTLLHGCTVNIIELVPV